MKVPFIDRNKIEISSKDTLVFHTYPKGVSVECERLTFKSRSKIFNNKSIENSKKNEPEVTPNIYAENDSDNKLIFGVLNNKLSTVKEAVNEGANVNIHERLNGNTPLILAAFYGHSKILKFLLSSGTKIDAECNEKNTALTKAAWKGNVEIVKELIKYHADINSKEIDGLTPLMVASFWGHYDVVEALIESGCSLNEKDLEGNTALFYSKEQGHENVSNILTINGAKE